MRLVFTKLTTPLNSILVDHGDGRGFVNIPVASLEGSEQYIELDDNAVEHSIRVKTSTEEIESFDMIKEYQIKDDEGNIIGGNIDQTIKFPIELFTYYDTTSYNYTIIFPYEITEVGKHTALRCSEGQSPYFHTITITRIDTEVDGFYAVFYEDEEEHLFKMVRPGQ